MAGIPSGYERTRCVRRGWVFERVGWVAMAVVAAAGAAGLFGDGWLSRAEARAGDELAVTYPRYARAHGSLRVTIDWLSRGDATLWIARSYLDGFEIHEIRPVPTTVTAAPERIYYTFRALERDGRIRVDFTLKPSHGGAFRGRLGAADTDVEVRQFVFP
jgi:hypothetical protein